MFGPTPREVARDEAVRAVERALGRDLAVLRAAVQDQARAAVGGEVSRQVKEARRVSREEARALAAQEADRCWSRVAERLTSVEFLGIVASAARDEARRVAADLVRDTTPRLVEVCLNGSGLTTIDGDTHRLLPDLLLTLGAGCHVFLVGPAGTGKSTMAKQAAQALGLEFYALSVGPTTPTSKMFGYLDAGGNYHRTPLRQAYEHGGMMLLDEIDNGHPGLLTELNQALSLDVCAFPDGMIRRHEKFRLVATGNTYGLGGDRQYVGRQALDAATLDRLVVIDVPVDEQLETRVTMMQAPSVPAAASWVLDEVRRLRALAAAKKLPVSFSPRASINAARVLEACAERAQAVRWCVTKGLSEAHRAALGLPAAS